MAIGQKKALLAAVLLLGGCAQYPRDPEATLDQVRERATLRIGLIAGGQVQFGKAQMLIMRLARLTKAEPVLASGEAEPLLLELEEGKLDLVLGTFDEKTPWGMRVTVGPPLRQTSIGKNHYQLAPAMRNGENAWISIIEREVRNLAPEAQ